MERSVDTAKNNIKNKIDELYSIISYAKSILNESDNYWSWATFFKDKKDDLMQVKEKGKAIFNELKKDLKIIRNKSGTNLDNHFNRLEKQREAIRKQIDKVKKNANIQTATTQGERLAGMLHTLLEQLNKAATELERVVNAA